MFKRAAPHIIPALIALSALATAASSEEPASPAAAASETTAAAATAAPGAEAKAASNAPPVAAASSLVTPDTDLLKRTPVIDGTVEDGEWDRFCSHSSGGCEVTTYANWDSTNLYVAAKSNQPIDLLCVLDAQNDGWFHGDENLAFKATRQAPDGLTLSVARYESRNTKSPVAVPVGEADAATVDLKSTTSADSYAIEMRVPTSLVRGLKLAAGGKIGFQVCVNSTPDESGWVPTDLVGDVRECSLVTRKLASLKPLVLGFELKDSTVARGEELVGRFHLTNGGMETLDARNYVIAGEGKAGAYLSSERIRIEGLPPKKHISREFRTVVPADMPVGSWTLGAEVRSASARLGGALISFDVVDPFEAELRLPSADVRADVKDVTFQVVVKNNTRRAIRGKAKVTLPVGWELWRNADTREFEARPRGSITFATFKAKPPLGEMGTVPVKAEVTVGSETKTVEGKFVVVNP